MSRTAWKDPRAWCPPPRPPARTEAQRCPSSMRRPLNEARRQARKENGGIQHASRHAHALHHWKRVAPQWPQEKIQRAS
eukprot:620373-Pyramimonas_sp.AAC.1